MKKTVVFKSGTGTVSKSFEVKSGVVVIAKKEMELIAKRLGYPVSIDVSVGDKKEKLVHGIPHNRSTECFYIELSSPVDFNSWKHKFGAKRAKKV
jgi:hypothetical protein